MIKKSKNKILPTYPDLFEHVTPNTHIFWPYVNKTYFDNAKPQI